MSKDDINLPKTSFSMKANLPNKEPEILKVWEKLELYKKLRESRKGNKKFIGEYEQGKAHGKWTGFHPNGNKKYEGIYEIGFQKGKWSY